MIEEVLEVERVGVTEAKDYDIEQKPGKDYWYVKRGGKKLGAISKGKNEKFDADTDTDGGGEYKAGFDTIAAAAEWLVSKDKTAKAEGTELTEDPVQGAFDHEVKPWLSRELEKLLGQLDKKMLGITRGQFPEKRMEYGITRYAPLSVGPKDFLKSLRTPYSYWRNKIRGMMEGVEPGGDELTEMDDMQVAEVRVAGRPGGKYTAALTKLDGAPYRGEYKGMVKDTMTGPNAGKALAALGTHWDRSGFLEGVEPEGDELT